MAIDVSVDGGGPTISPHIYGHFIEHLGGVIYDGIWVGPRSRIPNVGGIRKAFIDDMKRIGAPNLRWPGGCFADGYHWRDGIGGKRAKTYNYWQTQMPEGTDATEPNQFGTHEFMQLCKLVGAEPYLAANVGSSMPQEFYDWVSYCNAPAGTLSLADERAANGDQIPFNVRFWGVGNESWGCGGRMTPAEYAALYRKFTAQVPGYKQPFLIACGPRGHSADMDIGWTTGFFEAMAGTRAAVPDGFAVHYYTDFRPTSVKGESSTEKEWSDVLASGIRVESVIEKHWAAIHKFDPQHRTKLVIDEWGTWYSQGQKVAPSYILSQVMTLRDAVHAAMTFDIYNRHADKIAMTNIAQTINCLHSLFAAREDKYVRTPVFYVFEMYRKHMGARLVALKVAASGISGSASVRDKSALITLTNATTAESMPAKIRLNGVKEARATVLTHESIQATNTFEQPEEVKPVKINVSTQNDGLTLTIPPRAVVAIEAVLS